MAAYQTSLMTVYPASVGCRLSRMKSVAKFAFFLNAECMSTRTMCLPAWPATPRGLASPRCRSRRARRRPRGRSVRSAPERSGPWDPSSGSCRRGPPAAPERSIELKVDVVRSDHQGDDVRLIPIQRGHDERRDARASAAIVDRVAPVAHVFPGKGDSVDRPWPALHRSDEGDVLAVPTRLAKEVHTVRTVRRRAGARGDRIAERHDLAGRALRRAGIVNHAVRAPGVVLRIHAAVRLVAQPTSESTRRIAPNVAGVARAFDLVTFGRSRSRFRCRRTRCRRCSLRRSASEM